MAVMVIPIANAQIKIGEGSKGWDFNLIQEDFYVAANITPINSTEFEIEIYALPDTGMKNNYKWYLALCNNTGADTVYVKNEDLQGGFEYATEILANYDYLPFYGLPSSWCPNTEYEGHILFSAGSKNNLPKKFRVVLPKTAENFTLYAGDESIVIDASADTEATQFTWNPNIAVCPDGTYHVGYVSNGDDAWYGNSTDGGATWETMEVEIGTVDEVNVICDSTNKVTFIYEEGGLIKYQDSSDNFNLENNFYTGTPNSQINLNCELDSSDTVYCGSTDTNLESYMVGAKGDFLPSEYLDYGSDHRCDFVIDRTDKIHMWCQDANDDDIYYSNVSNGQYAKTLVYTGGTLTDNQGPSAASCDDKLFVTTMDAGDLVFCNSTIANPTPMSCADVDELSSANPAIAVNDNCDVYLLYTDGTTLTGTRQIFYTMLNASNNYNADVVRSTLITGGYYPSAKTTVFPLGTNYTSELFYVYTQDGPDMYFDNFTIQYTPPSGPPPEDTCTYDSGDWNIDCSDNCVIDSANNLGTNNVYAYGSGSVTITGTGSIEFTTGSFYASCNIYCYNDGCFG